MLEDKSNLATSSSCVGSLHLSRVHKRALTCRIWEVRTRHIKEPWKTHVFSSCKQVIKESTTNLIQAKTLGGKLQVACRCQNLVLSRHLSPWITCRPTSFSSQSWTDKKSASSTSRIQLSNQGTEVGKENWTKCMF